MRITRKVTFLSKPGKVKLLKELFGPMVLKSKEESGCLVYETFQDQDNPMKLFSIQSWQNEEAFEAHKQSEYYKNFNKTYLDFAEGQYIMELELIGY